MNVMKFRLGCYSGRFHETISVVHNSQSKIQYLTAMNRRYNYTKSLNWTGFVWMGIILEAMAAVYLNYLTKIDINTTCNSKSCWNLFKKMELI